MATERTGTNILLGRKKVIIEPCQEKTCRQGFLPGPTQIRLYSHKRVLKA